MTKIATVTLTGESGTKYPFNVYPYNTKFKEMGAVYYISKRIEDSEGKGSHTTIYVGQTSDLSSRFDDHHKESCFVKNEANCKSIHAESDEDKRFEIETDLVRALNPPCNG